MAKGEGGWIWSEFNTLLTLSLAASASSARKTLPLPFEKFYRRDRQTIGDSPIRRASRRRRGSTKEDDDAINVMPPFKRSRHSREFAKLTHDSLLIVKLDHSVIGETQQGAVARVSFVPKLKISKVGIVAQFASSPQRQLFNHQSPLDSRQHHTRRRSNCDSRCFSSNNLARIRQMVSARTLTPFDRFSDGSSLLSVC